MVQTVQVVCMPVCMCARMYVARCCCGSWTSGLLYCVMLDVVAISCGVLFASGSCFVLSVKHCVCDCLR